MLLVFYVDIITRFEQNRTVCKINRQMIYMKAVQDREI